MEVTRVRVRGKRKTPGTNLPVALQNDQSMRAIKTQKRSLTSVMAERALRPRPRLDTLPDEILESIFLYSANLALPRVNNFIGKRLSGRATLVRLILWAFHDTWIQWFGIPADKAIVHGPWLKDAKHFPSGGDDVFQSEVLGQAWINIDLILQAQQTWADNNAHGRWYQHSIPWDDESRSLEHDHEGGFSHFDARKCFEADYQQALKWPAFRIQREPWFFQDIHPKTRIPTELITGPWNEEMRRRVFWLCRGGFTPVGEDDSPLGWELKIELLRNAILNASEPNALIINCLVRNWVFADLPADVVRKELVDLERRLEWGATHRREEMSCDAREMPSIYSCIYRILHWNG
ncbi:hypothetical protein PT974_01163 [Cladobotryum mycophilum]|uniref:F-box domain-containing protein n=1 Tax=Cladobotryum mycophilum TaxID=491253 RepID=A0ABR0T430_9HYPO